jgi:hypothetical protein
LYFVRHQASRGLRGDVPYTVGLRSGVTLGFERDQEGVLVAVAGEMRRALGDGTYEWRFAPPPRDPTPLEKVGLAVLAVPAAAFIIVVGILVPGALPRC